MDLHHEIILLLLGGELHKAPINPNPHKILDVGTGTGIWAIDMADRYPSAEVIGVDLRCVLQPGDGWIGQNVRSGADGFGVDSPIQPRWYV